MSIHPNRFSKLRSYGFSVFPVATKGKKPALPWTAYQSSVAGEEDVEKWDASDFNVGVVCGRISDLIVIDIDSEEAQAFYDKLEAPLTPCVRTGRGRHYYYKRPTVEIRNHVRVEGVPLDVRGEGGYVVGVGSEHPDGSTYTWETSPDECAFASLPEPLERLLAARRTQPVAALAPVTKADHPEAQNRFSAWIGNAVEDGLSRIVEAQTGERNDTLNRVAFSIAQLVAAARLDWQPYAIRMQEAAMRGGLPVSEASSTIASAWTGGQKQPCPWIETAQRYVYLGARNSFYNVQTREGMSEAGFNRMFNSQRQWEKGSIAAFLTDHDLIDKAFDLRFDPERATGVYGYDNERWLNTYASPGIISVEGDWKPFTEFCAYLVPNEIERDHLLKMMAWTIRNPGKKLGHALLLKSTGQGIGKSMLMDIWRHLLGWNNTRLTSTEEITGNFQSFIEGNLLVIVEELNVAFGMQGYNRVKNLITGHTAEINEKFVSSRERSNYATFAFLTNLPEPILIEDSDRRFFFIDSPATARNPDYYSGFASWWKNNLALVRGFMDQIDLSDFNPFAPPPDTEAKQQLKIASRSPLEQEIAEAIAERRFPFSRDIMRLEEVRLTVPAARTVPLQRLKGVLKGLGGSPFGPHRVSGEWVMNGMKPIFVRGSKTKPSLWAMRNVEYWEATSPGSRVEEFSREEGMLAIFDGTRIEVRHASADETIYRELSSCPGGRDADEQERHRITSALLECFRS